MTINRTDLETDVLVLGGGAAGHSAALSAFESGARVIQLYKGPTATAISTGFLTYPVAGRVDPLVLRESLLETVGKGLCDRALLDRFMEDGEREISDTIRRYAIAVDPAPMGVRAKLARGRSGKELLGGGYSTVGVRDMTTLVMEFSATHGTSLFSGLLDAVRKSGIERIRGTACRIDPEALAVAAVIDGQAVTIKSNAIIIATGGVQGLYEHTDSPSNLTGDGIGLALEAGAAVTDMEFMQFYPLALAEPDAPSVFLYPDFPAGGRILNESGEDLMRKYFGNTQTLGDFANWDHLSVVMHKEILAQNKLYVDFSTTDEADWGNNSLSGIFLKKYVGDFLSRPIQVSPIAHYTVGGIRIDAEACTSIPGLYAVGEVAGGLHGANRHGGASLAECVVFGRIAGRNAASRPRKAGLARTNLPFEQRKGSSLPVTQIWRELRRLCQLNLGPLRNRKSLENMGERLRQLSSDVAGSGWTVPDEYAAVAGVSSALRVTDAMRMFMLRRTESRGVHARADFPQSSLEWLKRQTMSLVPAGGMIFRDIRNE